MNTDATQELAEKLAKIQGSLTADALASISRAINAIEEEEARPVDPDQNNPDMTKMRDRVLAKLAARRTSTPKVPTRIGLTRADKSESKKKRRMAKASRRQNRK